MSDDRPAVLAPRNPRHKTWIVLRSDAWLWLRARADETALREGGRSNVSAEIERLVRAARNGSVK